MSLLQYPMSRRRVLGAAGGLGAAASLTRTFGAAGAAAQADEPSLVLWTDPTNLPFFAEISEDFTATYGVEVSTQNLSFSTILSQTLLAAPAGQGPDLLEANHDWLGALLQSGILAPLELGSRLELIDPRAVAAYSAQGNLYGLPVSIESMFVARNTDLLPEPVTNWNEFDAVGEDLLARGIDYPLLIEPNGYLFTSILTAFGGYAFGLNADGSFNPEDVGVDSPGGIAAAAWLDSVVKKGFVKPDTPYDTASTLVSDGQAALYPIGPWILSTLRQRGVSYAIDPPPAATQDAKPFLAARGLLANSFGTQVALAQSYLTEFWANDEPMRQFMELTSRESPWLPIRDQTDDPDLLAMIDAGVNAEPMPSFPQMSSYFTALGDALRLILAQQSAPEAAFTTAADRIRQAIREQQ